MADFAPGVPEMTLAETERYYTQVADTEHLGERQRRNQGLQAPVWTTILSEEQDAAIQQAEAAHRRNAEDSRYNGQDAKARLASHGLNLDH
jgi:hypothetical protein